MTREPSRMPGGAPAPTYPRTGKATRKGSTRPTTAVIGPTSRCRRAREQLYAPDRDGPCTAASADAVTKDRSSGRGGARRVTGSRDTRSGCGRPYGSREGEAVPLRGSGRAREVPSRSRGAALLSLERSSPTLIPGPVDTAEGTTWAFPPNAGEISVAAKWSAPLLSSHPARRRSEKQTYPMPSLCERGSALSGSGHLVFLSLLLALGALESRPKKSIWTLSKFVRGVGKRMIDRSSGVNEREVEFHELATGWDSRRIVLMCCDRVDFMRLRTVAGGVELLEVSGGYACLGRRIVNGFRQAKMVDADNRVLVDVRARSMPDWFTQERFTRTRSIFSL